MIDVIISCKKGIRYNFLGFLLIFNFNMDINDL